MRGSGVTFFSLVDVGVGHRVARREAAGHGNEIRLQEHPLGLLFDQLDDVRIGHPLHRIMRRMPPGMKGRLEVDALDGGVIEAEADDLADLILIHAALDGGNQDHGAADLGQPVERSHLLRQNVGFAANDAIGLALEAIELEIDVGLHLGQLRQKRIVGGDALAVGVQHHVGNAARLAPPSSSE